MYRNIQIKQNNIHRNQHKHSVLCLSLGMKIPQGYTQQSCCLLILRRILQTFLWGSQKNVKVNNYYALFNAHLQLYMHQLIDSCRPKIGWCRVSRRDAFLWYCRGALEQGVKKPNTKSACPAHVTPLPCLLFVCPCIKRL